MKRSLKIGMSVAGTIIGAGFATGKELLVFFKGESGFYTILLISAVLLIGITSVIYFKMVKIKPDGSFFKIVFLTFAGGCYTIMLACGGQTLYDTLNFDYRIGVFITFLVTIIVIRFGIEGVYKFNAFATPLITISLILISVMGISKPVFNIFSSPDMPYVPYLNAILYAGYNILAVLPFISAISKETDEKEGISGIISGFLVVLITSIAVKLMLNNYFLLIANESIPILKIIGIISQQISYIYSVVLYTSIVTTGVNLLYVLVKKLNKGKLGFKGILLTSLPFLVISFLGFVSLLENIYTYFGYIGIVIIISIIGNVKRIMKKGKHPMGGNGS